MISKSERRKYNFTPMLGQMRAAKSCANILARPHILGVFGWCPDQPYQNSGVPILWRANSPPNFCHYAGVWITAKCSGWWKCCQGLELLVFIQTLAHPISQRQKNWQGSRWHPSKQALQPHDHAYRMRLHRTVAIFLSPAMWNNFFFYKVDGLTAVNTHLFCLNPLW